MYETYATVFTLLHSDKPAIERATLLFLDEQHFLFPQKPVIVSAGTYTVRSADSTDAVYYLSEHWTIDDTSVENRFVGLSQV